MFQAREIYFKKVSCYLEAPKIGPVGKNWDKTMGIQGAFFRLFWMETCFFACVRDVEYLMVKNLIKDIFLALFDP